MGFSFKKWNLYKADVQFKDDKRKTLHFFSKWIPKKGIPCDLPKDSIVKVNERTGLPYLKKKEDL